MEVTTDVANRNAVLRPEAHVKSMIDPAGAVLLDLRAGTYFSLNSVGSVIWQQVQAGASFNEIAHTLSATCGVDAGVVEADLFQFLNQLQQKGMIHVDR